MAKKQYTKNDIFREQLDNERSSHVYKADDMLQRARFDLTATEQKLILYVISKIKPGDSCFDLYTFQLKRFIQICGIKEESYTKLKKICRDLSNKSWWIYLDNSLSKSKESLVRWFTVVRVEEGTGLVEVKFHEDMFPYLLELAEGKFYTHYELRFILPMKSKYSIKLYELLKSYEKNNVEWWFSLDKLKKLLNCEKYERFPDFRRKVLEPAIFDINEYSDIIIKPDYIKQGNKTDLINFVFTDKKTRDKLAALKKGNKKLDGPHVYGDYDKNKENSPAPADTAASAEVQEYPDHVQCHIDELL